MAVIINEFEVLIEQEPASQAPSPVETPAPVPLRPIEIGDVLRRKAERFARLQAW